MVGQLGWTALCYVCRWQSRRGRPVQDGIITINSLQPVQFTRPVAEGNFDGRMFTEHEIDEVLGMGSHLWRPGPAVSCPTGLIQLVKPQRAQHQFEWPAFLLSIDRGLHNIVIFNQDPAGDFGDWDSDTFCPADRLYVNNAFNCPGQSTTLPHRRPKASIWMLLGMI